MSKILTSKQYSIYFILLFICIINAQAQISENNSVLFLNQTNFQYAQENNQHLFITFYKSDWKLYNKFLEELQQAAKKYKDNSPQVAFALINSEQNKNLTQKYRAYSEYNIILLLNQSNHVQEVMYREEMLADSIVTWLQRVTVDISQEINEKEELKSLMKANEVLLFYFGESENDKEFQEFIQAAYIFNDVKFAHTFSSSLQEQHNAKPHQIVLYNNFDNEKKKINLEASQVNQYGFKLFMDKNSYPEVMSCKLRHQLRVFETFTPALYLFVDKSEKSQEIENIFRAVAKKNKGRILFTLIKEENTICFNNTIALFSLSKKMFPVARIIGAGSSNYQFYKMEGDLNFKNLETFITKFRVKKIIPLKQSEPVPDQEEQDKHYIKKVVTDTFVDEVINCKKDVLLITIHTNYPNQESYYQNLEKVAELNKDTNLIFKYYDINKNDYKDLIERIVSIPQYQLFRPGLQKPIMIGMNYNHDEVQKHLEEKGRIMIGAC